MDTEISQTLAGLGSAVLGTESNTNDKVFCVNTQHVFIHTDTGGVLLNCQEACFSKTLQYVTDPHSPNPPPSPHSQYPHLFVPASPWLWPWLPPPSVSWLGWTDSSHDRKKHKHTDCPQIQLRNLKPRRPLILLLCHSITGLVPSDVRHAKTLDCIKSKLNSCLFTSHFTE